MNAPIEVVCVCGGWGFPWGAGSADRILLLGRSFLSKGIGFRLLHAGTSPIALNTESAGTFEGIPYEYTTGVVARPANKLWRALVYLRGYMVLTARLWQLRRERRAVVYMFLLGDPVHVYVNLVCKMCGLPVIQDVCEWWPGMQGASRFAGWIYRRFLPRYSAAAVAISELIQARLEEIASGLNRPYPVLLVPVLLDWEKWNSQGPSPAVQRANPYVFWLGSVDGYMNDVSFVIRALALVNRAGVVCDAVLAGPASVAGKRSVQGLAESAGLPPGRVRTVGFVEEAEVRTLCRNAAALLLPLWEDDHSRTRYPHKIADYLMAGRPVVTCPVGDIATLLEDGRSACFHPPGDVEACARKIRFLLNHPAEADAIGAGGRTAAKENLDYRVYADGLEKLAREARLSA